MRWIRLTQGYRAKIDSDDFAKVNQYKWYADTPHAKNHYVVYARRKSGRSTVSMHRFILGLSSRKGIVDHINMDGLDNRKCNLRLVSRGDSQRNTRPQRGRDIKYVYKVTYHARGYSRWRATIWTGGCRKTIGEFADREVAISALKRFVKDNNISIRLTLRG